MTNFGGFFSWSISVCGCWVMARSDQIRLGQARPGPLQLSDSVCFIQCLMIHSLYCTALKVQDMLWYYLTRFQSDGWIDICGWLADWLAPSELELWH